MYRRDSEFSVPIECSKSLAKYIRHIRYVEELERKHTVRYYDNIQIIGEETDYQRIALRLALVRYEIIEPTGYRLLIRFYYGGYPSIQSYADENGITRQTMSEKLHRQLEILRILAFEELDKLVT